MLALALGTSSAIFTVLDGFLWRPLPYLHPNRLVLIRERLLKAGLTGANVSFHAYSELRKGVPDILVAGTLDITGGLVTVHGIKHMGLGGLATPSLFQTLAVPPILGHWPSRASGRPGGPHEALLGYGFWKSVFGGSPDAIGQRFRFRGVRYRVVGVMPKRFYTIYPGADFWLPRVLTPAMTRDHNINHAMIARLDPGTSVAKLDIWLRGYRNRILASDSPAERARAQRNGYTIDAERLHHAMLTLYLGGNPVFLLFLALIGLLLPLIAVVNSINLTLVRTRQRAVTFAVRRALGASTVNLLRLMLEEYLVTLTLVILGSLFIADLCSTLFESLIGSAVNGPIAVALPFIIRFGDRSVLYSMAIALVVVSGIVLCAFVYAGRASFLASLMHEAGGRGTSRSARMIRRGFGGFQIIMATLLVMLGLLITQSLYGILGRPLGFHPQRRMEAMVLLSKAMSQNHFWTDVRPALGNLPGTRAAAVGFMVPFNNLMESNSTIRAPAPPHETVYVHAFPVSRDYFQSLHIPFVAGHDFTRDEETHTTPVAILSARLARRFYGTVEAVGRSFSLPKPVSVVGVVGDVAWRTTPEKHIAGTVYLPLSAPGFKFGATNVILRVGSASPAFLQSIRNALEQAAPGVAVTHLTTLTSMIHTSDRLYVSMTEITSIFALVALLLTIFGVYAMTAQSSLNRRQEYAIRSALGADPALITRLALAEAGWMLAAGLFIGVSLALLLTHLLQGALYGVSTINWTADLIGILLITLTVLVASWIPIRNTFRNELGDILKAGAA